MMMKILFILAFLFISLMPSQAEEGDKVKVTLKTGTSIVGEMRSFDPMQKVVMVIGGQETTILMKDVESVEMIKDTPLAPREKIMPNPNTLGSRGQYGFNKLMVTETRSYPERITVSIGDIPHEMVLVPGGKMNMGYDGNGSLSMKSEPIHEVEVTSFYISAQPLPASFVTSIVGTKHVDGRGSEPAEVKVYKDVEQIVSAVVLQTGHNMRLPTEAEWEYAACSDQQMLIFSIANGDKVAYEWCGDFWGEFDSRGMTVVDPTGPRRGREHVVRAYNARRGKFDRSNEVSGRCYQGLVRLAIKAINIQ